MESFEHTNSFPLQGPGVVGRTVLSKQRDGSFFYSLTFGRVAYAVGSMQPEGGVTREVEMPEKPARMPGGNYEEMGFPQSLNRKTFSGVARNFSPPDAPESEREGICKKGIVPLARQRLAGCLHAHQR